MAAVFGVMPRTGAVAVPPRIHSDVLTTWNAVPTPGLLCDRIFNAASTEDERWWHNTLDGLASFLGALHRVPVDRIGPALPDRTAESAWIALDHEASTGIRQAREQLPSHLAPLMAEKIGHHPTPPETIAVVHGRFSTGICALTSPVAIFGWREAGTGDPLSDIAYLMGEILEAAALTGVVPKLLSPRIETFLMRYQEAAGRSLHAADLERLNVLTARRVFDHYAQATWAFGPDGTLREVLPKVEKQWLVLRKVTGS